MGFLMRFFQFFLGTRAVSMRGHVIPGRSGFKRRFPGRFARTGQRVFGPDQRIEDFADNVQDGGHGDADDDENASDRWRHDFEDGIDPESAVISDDADPNQVREANEGESGHSGETVGVNVVRQEQLDQLSHQRRRVQHVVVQSRVVLVQFDGKDQFAVVKIDGPKNQRNEDPDGERDGSEQVVADLLDQGGLVPRGFVRSEEVVRPGHDKEGQLKEQVPER